MSIVNYNGMFGALMQIPEESCRLDRLPNAIAANVTLYLPDEDILKLYRACPDNPGIKKANELCLHKQSLQEQAALELAYSKGLEKLKTFARRGDLIEGMLCGMQAGTAAPIYGFLVAKMGARYGLNAMLVERLTRLSENAIQEFGSKPVQELFSMAVAGAAARLISNSIAETHFDAGTGSVILGALLKVSLSALAGILTIK